MYHQQRLEKTFTELFSRPTSFDLNTLIIVPDMQSYRCRFVYDEDHYEIEYIPYEVQYKKKLIYKEIDFNYKYKSLDRNMINTYTKDLASDTDVLFVKEGLICDTSIANIACKIDGVWFTPKTPLLKGTTRARLLDEKKLQTADITVKQCQNAQSIALFNALTGFYELD